MCYTHFIGLSMEKSPHYKSVTPEQVHAAKTTAYRATADLSLPPKSKARMGIGKTVPQLLAEAGRKRLSRGNSEMQH